MSTIDERAGWRPSEGDSITGRVAQLGRGYSDYSESYYPIVTLACEDGSYTDVHCFHTTLRNRLLEIQPKTGDRLTITYKGKKASKDGKREIAIYSVQAPDWVQDAGQFWQGVGAANPKRDGGPTAEPDIPADTEGLDDPPPF